LGVLGSENIKKDRILPDAVFFCHKYPVHSAGQARLSFAHPGRQMNEQIQPAL